MEANNMKAMREITQPDPDWKDICEKCLDGEIEPDCEYYGEPNGCNSPLYGQHPKQIPSCSPNCSIKQKVLSLDEAIAHAEECVDESTCGQNHRQLADWLKELKKLKVGGNAAAMREALVKVSSSLCPACRRRNCKGCPRAVAEFMSAVRKALALPPRNCDRSECDTPEKARIAWCRENGGRSAYADWLFAPATEQK